MSNTEALDTAGLDLTLADTQAIDDCWNRIGVRGDQSCPLLIEHIHCRNCALYAAAAIRLLDDPEGLVRAAAHGLQMRASVDAIPTTSTEIA